MKTRQRIVIICECGAELDETAQTQRAIEGQEAIRLVEYGVDCPHCKKWVHAFFLSSELDESLRNLRVAQSAFSAAQSTVKIAHTAATQRQLEKAEARYRFQEAAYRKAFDKLQTKWRRKLKISREPTT